jgi:hypothetical protein
MEAPMNTDTATRSDLDTLTALNRPFGAARRCAAGSTKSWPRISCARTLMGQFLAQTARPVTISSLSVEDVRVRVLGDVAIIHARTSYTTAGGDQRSGRYTDVWARRDGKSLAVSAHVTR